MVTSHTYGTSPKDFSIGDRVELHPGLDLWMRGARFGTVERLGHVWVFVRLDRLPKPRGIAPRHLRLMED